MKSEDFQRINKWENERFYEKSKMIQWWESSLEMRFNPRVLIHSRKLAWIANMINYLI